MTTWLASRSAQGSLRRTVSDSGGAHRGKRSQHCFSLTIPPPPLQRSKEEQSRRVHIFMASSSTSHSPSPCLSHTLGSLQILRLVIHFTPLLSLCGRTTVPPSQLTKSRSSSLSPRPTAAPAPPYSPRNYPY